MGDSSSDALNAAYSESLPELCPSRFYLGVDVGSVTTKMVIIEDVDVTQVLESLYLRTNGYPIEAVRTGLRSLSDRGYRNECIIGVGVTGSARQLVGAMVGADIVKNEITAHAMAAISQVPDVRTIIEIGGQDSKLILVRDQIVVDFAMNTLCAAGTGSFLDQQAFRLQIPIEDFGGYALRATTAVRIAGRCTVFAESDMVHKQQLGHKKEEIIAGLCLAMVRNYLNNVGKGKDIRPPVLFQGGVAHNVGIRSALEKELGFSPTVPKHFEVMGAWGSALLARDKMRRRYGQTQFRGFGASEREFVSRMRVCEDCSNRCEVTEAILETEVIARWGDRCEKWQS